MLEGVTDYDLALFFIRAASYGHSIPRGAGLYVGRILRNAKYLSCLLSREHWPGMEVESADVAKVEKVRNAIANDLELLRALRRARKHHRGRAEMKELIASVEQMLRAFV